ncbi:MAG: hypothetical protein Q8N05_05780 [Bacteroidota bacterium]|nr:hypothetical protein [Bacteroidota bacterium]
MKNYRYLGFSWLKKELPKLNGSISAIVILNGLNSTDATSKSSKANLTLGPLYNYQHDEWKGILGGYYQMGKTDNNLTLNAYMVNGYGEYRKNKMQAGLGLDLLSGNSDKTQPTKSRNFSTLYATNHKFYGYMDYFLNIPSDTKQRGLVDAYLRMGVNLKKNLVTIMDVHSFSLAHENNSGVNKIKKGLGNELDFLLEYKPSPIINVQMGYSMMFASKNMELIKGGDNNNYNGWAFLMLKVSPTFFSHEFKN